MTQPEIKDALLPTVSTPRSQLLKRKHGEVIDLTADEDATPARHTAAIDRGEDVDLPPARKRKLVHDGSDDGDTESEASFFEDFLDNIELEPYKPGPGGFGLSQENVTSLHAELRRFGPDIFIDKHIEGKTIPARLLGTAFGIDPDEGFDDDVLELFLTAAIKRAFRKRQKLPQYNTIDDVAKLLRTRRKIMVITGAGISTSLGIPDFRSKGTGFYDKIRNLGYNQAEEVFDIKAFDNDPSHFYTLAGDILPDLKRFSPTHAFVRLLQDQGRLQTNYTQNIDNLEELAGIEKERLVQCHGSFATASCRQCLHQVSGREIFADIRAKRVARCKRCPTELAKQRPPAMSTTKKKPSKSKLRKNDWESSTEDEDDAYDIPEPGVMKPDITFFGETLSTDFFQRFEKLDSKTVDLVIVIGTSLKVAPVSEMPNHLPTAVPHVYISREPIEHVNFDVQLLGDCDLVVYELCRRAGWKLRHEMIPKGLEVQVEPVEGSTYRWAVTPAIKKAEAMGQVPPRRDVQQ
ncbi:NAD-dependent histone deacetylase sir2 [Teratosphaeriaceae sp. CCFEE 6253]|nr:NAD-dependent histone deacetylase sir2 [Teratosphaeriaceae sp. CCFEE 6253]